MKELETERLLLRKIKLEDAEDMFNNWASDPKSSEMLVGMYMKMLKLLKLLLLIG